MSIFGLVSNALNLLRHRHNVKLYRTSKRVRPKICKLAVLVGDDTKMTPICFEVTRPKVKVTVTLDKNWGSINNW